MNSYEEALYKVLDNLLAAKNCEVQDELLRHSMVELLKDRFREIAVRTTNGANHAARSSQSFFDLERTFAMMNIKVGDLKAICQGQQESESEAIVECPGAQTRDEDFHRGPQPMLSMTTKAREMGCNSHIPDYLPPYPAAHTYKHTIMKQVTDRSYVTVRTRHAENQLSTVKALNRFYLGCSPSISLFENQQGDDSCRVLSVVPPKKPAYLDALMPRSQVFETDIYECKKEITHGALVCPFLMEPKKYSSPQSTGNYRGENVEIQELRADVELDSDSDEEGAHSVQD
ncbi:transcription initiation factor TFIID subunit 8 [Drosophila ficusphila]|uniref:transcription initiation factor TFIID subunit 8 n=1 Tax=Drosophila ficusphila TaxID=30025 RepID=UPI0007E6C599|nr:transcription initiation factor TFIID subunit 8 [Drosophila ficusphila]